MGEQVYVFDDFLIGFWKLRFFHRQSPGLPLQVTRTKRLSVVVALSCLQVACLCMKLAQYLYSEHINWDDVLEATAVLCPAAIAVCQGCSHLLNRKLLERLIGNLEKLFPQSRREQVDLGLEPYAEKLLWHRSFIDTLGRCTTALFNSLPLAFCFYQWLILGRDFPFKTQFKSWYPLDTRSWVLFPIVFAFELATSIWFGVYLINDYLFYILATSQMQMHYRNLGKLMSEMDSAGEETKAILKLGRLVDYHCVLDKLRDDVNAVFSATTYIGFGITKLSTCLFMYTVLQRSSLIVLPTLTTLCIFLVLSTFMRCSNGSAVYGASEELMHKIYESKWYERTPRYRRMLAFMMARANIPVELHALKIKAVQMNTFKELVTEAYEIFMFLVNFSKH